MSLGGALELATWVGFGLLTAGWALVPFVGLSGPAERVEVRTWPRDFGARAGSAPVEGGEESGGETQAG